MDKEGKNNTEEIDTKEELAGALHASGKLPSLRTYQGDVASFIQSKDKSVAAIAIKNKEEKQERRKEEEEGKRKNFFAPVETQEQIKEKHQKEDEPRPAGSRSPVFLISILGIVLLVASVGVGIYIFASRLKDQPVQTPTTNVSIIRSDKSISLDSAGFSPKVFEGSLLSAKANKEYAKGITVFEISNSSNENRISSAEFFDGVEWEIPAPLVRSLAPEFAVGLWGGGADITPELFLILKTKDYGIAFRDMLVWEDWMIADLGSLLNRKFTEASEPEWKDIIVKNKDARGFVERSGSSLVVYTFINQNTILITETETAMTSLVNSYVAGNAVR